jgi:hypothetical protein
VVFADGPVHGCVIVGSLHLPTGRFMATEPGVGNRAFRFTVTVPPGTCPVELSITD